MGLTSSTVNVARFKVATRPTECEEAASPEDAILEILSQNPFKPIDDLPLEEYSAGWVRAMDPTSGVPIDTEDDCKIEGWFFFTLRWDRRSIPGKNLMQQLRKEITGWLATHPGMTRPPARVKAELKEIATKKLLPKTLPRQTSVDVAWNYETNDLLMFTASQKQIDLVEEYLIMDFDGIVLRPLTPISLYSSFGPEHALQNKSLSAGILDEISSNKWLGRDIASFVLFRSANCQVDYNGGIGALPDNPNGVPGYNLFYDDKAVLEHSDTCTPRKATLVGHITDNFSEIRAGLKAQLDLKEIKIGVDLGRNTYQCRINLTTFDLLGVRLPKSEITVDANEAPEVIFGEMVLDRLVYLQELYRVLNNFLFIFALIRSNDAQWGAWNQAIWRWICEEV